MAKVEKATYDDGYVTDSVTKDTQKGYDNYEKTGQKAQKDREAQDQKMVDTVKSGIQKAKSALGFAKGGKVSQMKKSNGIAQRGLTRGKIV